MELEIVWLPPEILRFVFSDKLTPSQLMDYVQSPSTNLSSYLQATEEVLVDYPAIIAPYHDPQVECFSSKESESLNYFEQYMQ